MSDQNIQETGEAPAEKSLSDIVLAAPEKIWRKIKQALGVKERQEAADLVGSDPGAARIAQRILASVPQPKPTKEGEPADLGSRIYPPGRPQQGSKGLKF